MSPVFRVVIIIIMDSYIQPGYIRGIQALGIALWLQIIGFNAERNGLLLNSLHKNVANANVECTALGKLMR